MVKRSRSKRYLENKKKVSEKKTSILNDAIKAFKFNKAVKFDETLDISVMLNKEKNKGEGLSRGYAQLPNGTGKTVRILVLAMGEKEKEANDARLVAAAAVVAVEQVKKAAEVEQYAKVEAKLTYKEAKKAEKEAKKKAKEAAKLIKKAIRDSLDLGEKSFITFSYTIPFLIEPALQNHTAKTGYTIGLGRRDLYTIRQMDINLGLEMNWYDFESDTTEENFQTLSYYLVAQLDPKFSWYWLPKNMEMGFKMGAGLISPGYGFTAGYSAVFNLSPTPLAIGLVTQFNWVANITSDIPSSYWSSVGLVFGLNFEDKLPSLF